MRRGFVRVFFFFFLHDIGTTGANLEGSRLSFEFVGGFLALRVLQKQQQGGDKGGG